jgi:AhpD family alkylhydroperoxidase
MEAQVTPRIGTGGRREIGLVNYAIVRLIGFAVRGDPPNVFTTLARHRGLFRRWLWFAGGLMPGGKLPRRETELAILRVAHNTGSDYERDQHERIGREAGLSEEEIERVGEGASAGGWSARERAVLEATDQLHLDRNIDDELWARLRALFDERELIELCMLVGHYEMLAMTLNSLRVQPDAARQKGGGRWLSSN